MRDGGRFRVALVLAEPELSVSFGVGDLLVPKTLFSPLTLKRLSKAAKKLVRFCGLSSGGTQAVDKACFGEHT